jgi:hypothetical protein
VRYTGTSAAAGDAPTQHGIHKRLRVTGRVPTGCLDLPFVLPSAAPAAAAAGVIAGGTKPEITNRVGTRHRLLSAPTYNAAAAATVLLLLPCLLYSYQVTLQAVLMLPLPLLLLLLLLPRWHQTTDDQWGVAQGRGC